MVECNGIPYEFKTPKVLKWKGRLLCPEPMVSLLESPPRVYASLSLKILSLDSPESSEDYEIPCGVFELNLAAQAQRDIRQACSECFSPSHVLLGRSFPSEKEACSRNDQANTFMG